MAPLDVEIGDALARALVPTTSAAARRTNPEFYLDVVVKSGLDVSIADAITGGEIERTMEGASTLSLTLFDPHRALLRNPDLGRAIDMTWGGYWWRLVKLSKQGDNLSLAFEDRDVAYLRSHTKPRKTSRNTLTRAEFIRQLVREVGQRPATGRTRTGVPQRIAFSCPELHERQPVAKAKAPTKRTSSERDTNKQPGLNPRAKLTVKGRPASAEQRRNAERVLDVADELGAGPKATLAVMQAVIVESEIRNLSHGLDDSIGILQVRVSLHGRDVAASIEKSVHAFMAEGFRGLGGAMQLARTHSGWSAAAVAQAVQGSAPAVYGQFADEAKAWVDAYGGAAGSDTGGTAARGSAREKKKYEFRRGEPGKREDSWTAIGRLADEVAWHAYMDRGTLHYVSDDWLMRQKARYIVSEDDDGIQEINFDIDTGKVSSDVTVSARADAFDIPVGCVMALRDCGIANGRYLVTRVHQSIYDYACEITLRAATPKLPEPEAQDVGATARATQAKAGVDGGSLRDRIVAVAKASAANYKQNPGQWFYAQGGAWNVDDPTKPPQRGNRSDCSQWIAAVYKKAGAPAPGPNYSGIYTGNMRVKGHGVPTAQAKPGDIILYGPPPSRHVEIYVGPGQRTIGHGSAPVDEGTIGMLADPHCWRYDFLD